MASEAIKLADRGNVQTDVRAINVSDFKYEVKLNHDVITIARESIGPLPTCVTMCAVYVDHINLFNVITWCCLRRR